MFSMRELGAVGVGALVFLSLPAVATIKAEDSGLTLVFEDDFERSYLNEGPGIRYNQVYPTGERFLVGERQIYVDEKFMGQNGLDAGMYPFEIDAGLLRISARRLPESMSLANQPDFVSGLITTQRIFAFQYGRMEIRANLPGGTGLWPALWLFPHDHGSEPYGEIDIVEVTGFRPGIGYFTIHAGPTHAERRILQGRIPFDPPLTDVFRVYGLEWTADEIAFSVDGEEVMRVSSPKEVRRPMYILANLAVGGPGGGQTDETTPSPATLEIDYIRVWQRPGDIHWVHGEERVAGDKNGERELTETFED